MTAEELQAALDEIPSLPDDELLRRLQEALNDVESGVADDHPYPTAEQMQTMADALQAEVDSRGIGP